MTIRYRFSGVWTNGTFPTRISAEERRLRRPEETPHTDSHRTRQAPPGEKW